ncbi:hypothetical protein FGIG_02563 [Fasciola gigantica]|uniref:Uncharacterized protein n=1 Tax=Fasciola gigantica TaxID=46835 RepID=A0A504Z0W0_FASGI|nr:hypothetical protein FGIG_02563 [Fasciola gigantica]
MAKPRATAYCIKVTQHTLPRRIWFSASNSNLAGQTSPTHSVSHMLPAYIHVTVLAKSHTWCCTVIRANQDHQGPNKPATLTALQSPSTAGLVGATSETVTDIPRSNHSSTVNIHSVLSMSVRQPTHERVGYLPNRTISIHTFETSRIGPTTSHHTADIAGADNSTAETQDTDNG